MLFFNVIVPNEIENSCNAVGKECLSAPAVARCEELKPVTSFKGGFFKFVMTLKKLSGEPDTN